MDDRELVRCMLKGERQAFEDFFEFYYPRLNRFVLTRVARNEDVAEEVVQQTMCIAVAKLEGYRGEAALITWLYTLCRHEIVKYFRRNPGRALQTELVEDAEEIRAALESISRFHPEDPEEFLQRKEISRVVRLVLDMLPVHYNLVLQWKYMEGQSVKEIAVKTGTNWKAAESLLTRAREAFREALASFRGSEQLIGRKAR